MSHGIILNYEKPVIQINNLINKSLQFQSTDQEKLFLSNKFKMGHDWYYFNNPIDYDYNSWGYRSKEFIDLKDDYLITFGCSYTEGIGLHHGDLWTTKFSNKINLDCLNMGVGGSGIDFQYYNTMLLHNFLLKNKKFPKLVIYQWPATNRTSVFLKSENSQQLNIEFVSAHFKKFEGKNLINSFHEWYETSFVDNQGELLKNFYFYITFCNNVWKSLGIPVLNFTWSKYEPEYKFNKLFDFDILIDEIYDNTTHFKARDLSHSGPLSQDLVVKNLTDQLIEKNIDITF